MAFTRVIPGLAFRGVHGCAAFVGCHSGLPLFCQSFGYAAGGATCSAGEEGTVNAVGLNERRLLCAVARLGLGFGLLVCVPLRLVSSEPFDH